MATPRVAIVLVGHSIKDEAGKREYFKTETAYFDSHGYEWEIFEAAADLDAFIDQMAGFDIALGAGNPVFNERSISALPRLKIIQRYGIGLNSIDLEAATRHGKIVYYMPGYCLEELALHATGLILCCLRNIVFYDRGMRRGEWLKGGGPAPRRLSGLTVGLFGLGGSGGMVARIMGKGFGARVVAHDPYIGPERAAELGVDLLGFHAFLKTSDIISIHAPLTRETHHVFNAGAFAKMKGNAAIINISRGPLIDGQALIEALRKGTIGFAGLDVFEDEPLAADSPLLAMDNVVLTPHTAYYGVESLENQRYLAPFLPVSTLEQRVLYLRHLANKEVAVQFPGYRKVEEAVVPR